MRRGKVLFSIVIVVAFFACVKGDTKESEKRNNNQVCDPKCLKKCTLSSCKSKCCQNNNNKDDETVDQDMNELNALHQLVQDFAKTQNKMPHHQQIARNTTLRRNTIQQHATAKRTNKTDPNNETKTMKNRQKTIQSSSTSALVQKKELTTTAAENLSIVNTIERLQSEIGEEKEEEDATTKTTTGQLDEETVDTKDEPTIMLEDTSSGSGSGVSSGSGKEDEEEQEFEEEHSSESVPVIHENKKSARPSKKESNSKADVQPANNVNVNKLPNSNNKSMFRNENRTADQKEVDVVDNQDIEDSIQMEKEDEEEGAVGDDESEQNEEQRTISALFKLHDDEQEEKDGGIKGKNENQVKNLSKGDNDEGRETSSEFDTKTKTNNNNNKQKVVMFQGKQQHSLKNAESTDINPSIVKEALKIFSNKNKQSLVKKHEEGTPNNSNNTSSNVVLSIPSDRLKNLTDAESEEEKDRGKTIILAVPVKLTDKDMVEKQVEAIKEKLLSIGNYQKIGEEKTSQITSQNHNKEDKTNNMEVTKDENRQSSAKTESNSSQFTLPGKAISEDQHLQDISKNPVSSVTGSSHPVLDELKGEGPLSGPEKQNKGFLEAIAKMKNEKEAASQVPLDNGSKATSPSLQLNTENEDNSDESKLAPESHLVQQQHVQNSNNNNNKAAAQQKPHELQQKQQQQQQLYQQQIRQQQQQRDPLLQPVPKVAFEQTTTVDMKFPQHKQQLHKEPTPQHIVTKENPLYTAPELQKGENEEENNENEQEEETVESENNENLLQSSNQTIQHQQQKHSSHFKTNPFKPSHIPMSFHANEPKDVNNHVDGAWCKTSCKTLCAPNCRFECCRVNDRKNQIKKTKEVNKKDKNNNKSSTKKRRRKTKKLVTKENPFTWKPNSKKIEMKVKSINERINKLIAEKQTPTNYDASATTTTSSLFQHLPHFPKFNKKINYDSKKGHKFLKETQEKLHSLIEMLSKSSNQLTTAATDISPSKKSLTCDVRCKVVCLPSCRFDCCKHDDEKR